MELTLTTPAVLFPAVSLLLLAYTNRSIALETVIRTLHGNYLAAADKRYLGQIDNLRRRVRLVRNMQYAGVLSLLLCTVCMFILFWGFVGTAEWIFSGALVSMILSLFLSLVEIQMSVGALDIHLQDIKEME